MSSRVPLYLTALAVVAALLVASAIRGETPGNAPEWLAPVGPAVVVVAAALFVFDRWAWRWPLICKIHGRPILHGTWRGELASDWEVEPGKRLDPDPDVFLVIRQRFSHISARLYTKESSSASTNAELRCEEDRVYTLLYLYVNSPRPEVRFRSERHYGVTILTAPQQPSDGLNGEYFTDRKTRGELRFRHHFPDRLIESHEAGRALVASKSDSVEHAV